MKQRIQGFLAGVIVMLAFGAMAAASARLTYNQTFSGGKHLANAVSLTTQALAEANRAQQIASSVTAGGVTQANLEGSAEFGAAAGQGPALYSAITTLQTDLTAIQTAQLLGNLDQGN